MKSNIKGLIKKDGFSLIYLYGEEKGLVSDCLSMMIREIEGTDYEITYLNDENYSAEYIYEIMTTVSFMATKNAIIAIDIEQSKIDEGISKLKELFAEEAAEGILVFAAKSVSYPGNRSVHKLLLAEAKKSGEVQNFKNLSPQETSAALYEFAKENGHSVPKSVCAKLYDYVKGDTLNAKNELLKLIYYKDGAEITDSDIAFVAVADRTASVFDIGRRIVRGNINEAMVKLDSLLFNKEDEIFILGALATVFIDIQRVHSIERKSDILQHFDYKGKEFRLDNAIYDAKRISKSRIEKIVMLLSECDIALKRTAVNKRLLLEDTIFKIHYIIEGKYA